MVVVTACCVLPVVCSFLGARYLLLVRCWLVFVVCLSFAGCCLLFDVVWWRLFAVRCVLLAVCSLSSVRCLLFVDCCL